MSGRSQVLVRCPLARLTVTVSCNKQLLLLRLCCGTYFVFCFFLALKMSKHSSWQVPKASWPLTPFVVCDAFVCLFWPFSIHLLSSCVPFFFIFNYLRSFCAFSVFSRPFGIVLCLFLFCHVDLLGHVWTVCGHFVCLISILLVDFVSLG